MSSLKIKNLESLRLLIRLSWQHGVGLGLSLSSRWASGRRLLLSWGLWLLKYGGSSAETADVDRVHAMPRRSLVVDVVVAGLIERPI